MYFLVEFAVEREVRDDLLVGGNVEVMAGYCLGKIWEGKKVGVKDALGSITAE